jgi:hypothetical protein
MSVSRTLLRSLDEFARDLAVSMLVQEKLIVGGVECCSDPYCYADYCHG